MKKYLINSLVTAAALTTCLLQVGCVINPHDPNHEGHYSGADEIISDSAITAAVKGKYLADPNINALNIHVKTYNGQVTLTGIVPNTAMRNLAISLAQNTNGVTKVNSKLMVR